MRGLEIEYPEATKTESVVQGSREGTYPANFPIFDFFSSATGVYRVCLERVSEKDHGSGFESSGSISDRRSIRPIGMRNERLVDGEPPPQVCPPIRFVNR